jgi:hypothetical protein
MGLNKIIKWVFNFNQRHGQGLYLMTTGGHAQLFLEFEIAIPDFEYVIRLGKYIEE